MSAPTTMLSPLTKIALNPDVISTTLATGEAVLMHMATANYFTLNATGLRIWQLLEAEPTLQEVTEHLVAEYDVTSAQAERSVLALTEQLLNAELIAVNG